MVTLNINLSQCDCLMLKKMFQQATSILFGLWIILLPIAALDEDTIFPCYDAGELRSGRIVGGIDADPGQTPYVVSLTRRGGHYCGGVIINDRWLLTAGHCICNGLGRFMSAGQIKAVLGQHRISDFKNNEIQTTAYQVDISQIVPHSEYSCTSPANDIALLKLTRQIKFSDAVHSACISINDDGFRVDERPMVGIVSGWGWTNEDQAIGDRADVLQKAAVTIFSSETCRQIYADNPHGVNISDSQICAGYTAGGIDSCWADSGGPLISENHRLIGVVSTGIGCARPDLPGIYTKVSYYSDWIRQYTRV